MRPTGGCVLFVVVQVGFAAWTADRCRQPPTAADYGQWETPEPQSRGGLSPDGEWSVYGVNRPDRNNDLHVRVPISVLDRVHELTRTAAGTGR